jgi:hypothetical protein
MMGFVMAFGMAISGAISPRTLFSILDPRVSMEAFGLYRLLLLSSGACLVVLCSACHVPFTQSIIESNNIVTQLLRLFLLSTASFHKQVRSDIQISTHGISFSRGLAPGLADTSTLRYPLCAFYLQTSSAMVCEDDDGNMTFPCSSQPLWRMLCDVLPSSDTGVTYPTPTPTPTTAMRDKQCHGEFVLCTTSAAKCGIVRDFPSRTTVGQGLGGAETSS